MVAIKYLQANRALELIKEILFFSDIIFFNLLKMFRWWGFLVIIALALHFRFFCWWDFVVIFIFHFSQFEETERQTEREREIQKAKEDTSTRRCLLYQASYSVCVMRILVGFFSFLIKIKDKKKRKGKRKFNPCRSVMGHLFEQRLRLQLRAQLKRGCWWTDLGLVNSRFTPS